MTQGELYKVINKDIADNEHNYQFEELASASVAARWTLIAIRDLLDEAKKDFPLESDFLLAIAEKGFERATFQFLLDLHLKRNAWFEKWFGDANP